MMESFHNIYTESISRAHLLNVTKMWLYKYDNCFYMQSSMQAMDSRLLSFFDIIFCVLQNYKFPESMIIPILIYADKFAARQSIKHDQLFYMMLSSAVVCVKFWNDTPTLRNSAIARAFNYSIKSVNSIERNFLKGIDYDLNLSYSDIIHFMQAITSQPYYLFSVPPALPSSNSSSNSSATPSSPAFPNTTTALGA